MSDPPLGSATEVAVTHNMVVTTFQLYRFMLVNLSAVVGWSVITCFNLDALPLLISSTRGERPPSETGRDVGGHKFSLAD